MGSSVYETAVMTSNAGAPVYLYELSKKPSLPTVTSGLYDEMAELDENFGVGHGDDLAYLFDSFATQNDDDGGFGGGGGGADYGRDLFEDTGETRVVALDNSDVMEDKIRKIILREDESVAAAFVKTWTNFAHYANPTPSAGDGLPAWTRFAKDSEHFFVFQSSPVVERDFHSERMFLWRHIFWRLRVEEAFWRGKCQGLTSSSK